MAQICLLSVIEVDMIKKEELDKRLLFFNPEFIFAYAIGEIKLVMEVDAFNEHINWVVHEGDYCTEFDNFPDARDYYLKAIECK